jgi:citrate-Mg2+:H+ or citrate-Ca2+:H+ symporter, CitMHS family
LLAILGVASIVILLLLIFLNILSPLVTLIVVPIAAALIGGFGLGTAKFVIAGISAIAPVAGMFVFAILFFGIMTDAGMLDPVITRLLKFAHGRPARITVGSALLTLLIHLDGSGAVCFLIAIPAMLPLYDNLNMDRRILACVASMAAGVNFLPWTGPMLRASAALGIPAVNIFRPLLPVQLVGLIFVFSMAYLLGKREERRLGLTGGAAHDQSALPTVKPSRNPELMRPDRFWINVVITLAVVTPMIAGWVDPVVILMLGTAGALIVNYPNVTQQRKRIDAHAPAAMMMAGILFAAGAFTGIMNGTGMLKAMANAAVAHLPHSMGMHIPFALGLVSMPSSLLFDPDSFYFGVLPVISHTVAGLGGQPIQVAQAALLGQMTLGFPVSPLTPATFLLVGLAGIELGRHQKFTIPYLWATSIIMTIAAVLFGIFPI